jgi:hypothetical protein
MIFVSYSKAKVMAFLNSASLVARDMPTDDPRLAGFTKSTLPSSSDTVL